MESFWFRFQFSDDLHIVGNITVTGNVDGIDISMLDTDDVSGVTNKYYTGDGKN